MRAVTPGGDAAPVLRFSIAARAPRAPAPVAQRGGRPPALLLLLRLLGLVLANALVVARAILGGLARAGGAPSLAVLQATLNERSPKLRDENLAACEAGWQAVDAQLREEAPR